MKVKTEVHLSTTTLIRGIPKFVGTSSNAEDRHRANPAKPWRYLPKENVPTTEEGAVTVVGAPTGTEECVTDRPMGTDNTERRCGLPVALPGRHTRQASDRSRCHRMPWTKNQLPRTPHGRGCVLRRMQGADNKASWVYNHIFETYRKPPRHHLSSRGNVQVLY